MADDYVEVSVTPEQYKALSSDLKSAAPAPSQPVSAELVQSYLPPVSQSASQPMDIGGALGGFFKGLGRGVTADIYDPKLSQAEQGGAAVGDTVGTLGTNALLGLGGATLGTLVEPGGGTILGGAAGPAAYSGIRTAQEELHAGKPLNPADIGAQTLLGGALGAIAPGEGALLPKIIKGAAVGGLGSGAMDAAHQYFNNNGHVMLPEVLQSAGQGAILGGGLPVAERALGHVISQEKGATPENSANAPEPTKDPVTGMLTLPQTELPPAPPAGPGVLTGKVEYKTEAPESSSNAPWDDGDDNDGGGSPAPISPETGQPAQQEQQPEQQPENITSAIQQVQQRRALLQQMQQQGQAIEAGQQANQAAANPSAEAVQGAQSAADILRARQQELLRQQQEQAIQQKADEIHSRLTNYERVGAKSQANKLKAEIAEQAASHPDPIQRAAYQRALDKYAPKEEPTPEPTLPPVENKPVEQPTVKLSGTVSKEGTTNEPKTVKLFRGVVNGRSNGLDNDTFWSPERETAELYSKGPNNESGQVLEDNVTFNNLFETQNWMTAKKELGLPYDTSMPDLLSAIKAKGYDGVTWRGAHGPEYIKFPAKGGVNEPQGPISNPQGEASQPEGQQHAQEQAQEVQPSGEQEPAEQTSQEALKPGQTIADSLKPASKYTPEVQTELDRLDSEHNDYRQREMDRASKNSGYQQQASKNIKGHAMETAARKREVIQGDSLEPVEGGLTDKELKARVERENSNYTGKAVTVKGKPGKVAGNAFGRVKVQFEDGSTAYFSPDEVTAAPRKPAKSTLAEQPSPAEPTIKPKPAKKPNKAKTTLGDVIGEALSGDYEGFDEPKAYDTLQSLGYEPNQISKEKNTLAHGKQYSVKISGRVRRFGEGDTLAKFLGDNGISADTLGRGVNIRGKSFNVERLLDSLPDTPAKLRYLEEQGTPQGKQYETEEAHRYEAAQKAYDLIHGSATAHELLSRYDEIFSDNLPAGDWEDIANEFDAKAEEFEHALSNDAGRQGSEGKGNGESAEDHGSTKGEVPGSVHSEPSQGEPGITGEVKKKAESSTEEALDAIYPEKPYPKEGLFDHARPQGTDQREHFLEAQAHKAGKFLSPAEVENHEGFSEAYNRLTPDEKEKLHAVADAIINKKKVKTGFYNPGTETEAGVLTKRSGHGQELYSPKGLSITKKGDIVVHGYNENAEISSRRLDRFSGKVEKTTEEGYNGLYKHPSDINESETFHPADSIVEQVANPILKKQVMGKPIVESDYRAAAKNLSTLLREAGPSVQEPEDIKGILDRLPEPVKEYLTKKGPCD